MNPKYTDRQVEVHPRCFLFGHYDSRGGATLIPAPHLIEAFRTYAQAFGYDRNLEDEEMRKHFGNEEEYRTWLPNAIHGLLEEDFMFSCNVIVCDEPFG